MAAGTLAYCCGGWDFLRNVDQRCGECRDVDLAAGVCIEDEFFEIGLAVHVGAEEDGNAEEDRLKNIMAADCEDEASADDGDIGKLIALVKQAHGIDEDEAVISISIFWKNGHGIYAFS